MTTTAKTTSTPERLPVLKTYKIYVGGKFPRTESGRYDALLDAEGRTLANLCRCSRKDARDAVTAARAAQSGWAARSAYNRGQILYRIGEMLEGRSAQFTDELTQLGASETDARAAVANAVDRCIYYAGWADKVQQVFSSVNPVSSSHFNFSILEPTGVVAVFAPDDPLAGLVSVILPTIVSGNTCVVVAGPQNPLPAISFAEVLNSSDVPGGVVNILTGRRDELLAPLASHRDVNALVLTDLTEEQHSAAEEAAAENVKRVVKMTPSTWANHQDPYAIVRLTEVKTTWHPIGT